MAHQITFKPQPVDERKELMQRVQSAPQDHAEALLAAWDLLETSHDKGILDMVQGLMGARDMIAGKLAEAANSADGVNAVRNLIALGRILAAIDPDMLYRVSKALDRHAPKMQQNPPSLLSLFRQFRAEDTRRGLAYGLELLAVVGAATRE